MSAPAPRRSISTSRRTAAEAGIAGLEFLSGIPGTIGGALRMNAGAYGREIKDVVIAGRGARPPGPAAHAWPSGDSASPIAIPACRRTGSSSAPSLPASAARPTRSCARMAEIQAAREASQPIRTPHRRLHLRQSARPQGLGADRRAGCRGLRARRRHGLREALQFPDQHRQRHRRRYRDAGRDVRRRVREATRHRARDGKSGASASQPAVEEASR